MDTSMLVTFLFMLTMLPKYSSKGHHHPFFINEPSALEYYDESFEQLTSESSNPIIPWRQINFISPTQELAHSRWWYEAPLSFSAKGMDHLYMLNQIFMEWLQLPGVPPGFITEDLFQDPELVVKQNRAKVRIPYPSVHHLLGGHGSIDF